MKIKKTFFVFVVFVSFFLLACGQKQEKIDPLYEPKKLEFKNIVIDLDSKISGTEIDSVSLPQKLVRFLFGGVPFIAELFELPLDLTTAILLPFKIISH